MEAQPILTIRGEQIQISETEKLLGVNVCNNLNKTETKMLTDFHVNLLRRIQALPARTAIPAVYLLLGALPLEAELHKKHLSLLYSIINSQNKIFHQLISRSIIIDEDQQGIFFGRVKVILAQYSLPSIEQL